MGATTAAQVAAVAYRALASDEREEAFRLIREARADAPAEGRSSFPSAKCSGVSTAAGASLATPASRSRRG